LKMNRLLSTVALGALSMLAGCSEDASNELLFEVKKKTFEHRVTAQGNLAALSSTQISGAAGAIGVLDYIVPNNTRVAQGDIIARMDISTIEAELSGIESDLTKVTNENRSELIEFQRRATEIGIQQSIVEEEIDLINRFDVELEGVYSRIELIDKMRNKDYTLARGDYLEWDESSNSDRLANKSTLTSLSEQRVKQRQQFAKMQLNAAVITAPHDGVVSLKRDWRQNLFASGMVVFPGMTLAELPNYDDLGGEVTILAINVPGVEQGAEVEATLSAYPDITLKGSIDSIAKLGTQRPGQKGSWHDAKIRFAELPDIAREFPTLTFTASILVASLDDQLVIPAESVSRKEGMSWVTMANGDKRQVELGARNQSEVVVVSGLSEGEEIKI